MTELLKVSPQRLTTLARCGVEYKLRYVDNLPPEESSLSAFRGRVVHKALERWSGDRQQALAPIVEDAWLECAEGQQLQTYLLQYRLISGEVREARQQAIEIRAARGEETKAVVQTKEYRNSPAVARMKALAEEWSDYFVEERPFGHDQGVRLAQFYDMTVLWADDYEPRWRHLPPPISREARFRVPFQLFLLEGVIDSVEYFVTPNGEVRALVVNDYKTYVEEPSQGKHFQQILFYWVALREMHRLGMIQLPLDPFEVPLWVAIEGVFLLQKRFFQVGPESMDRFIRELYAYKSIVEGQFFLPKGVAMGGEEKMCSFPSLCCQRNCLGAGGAFELVAELLP